MAKKPFDAPEVGRVTMAGKIVKVSFYKGDKEANGYDEDRQYFILVANLNLLLSGNPLPYGRKSIPFFKQQPMSQDPKK